MSIQRMSYADYEQLPGVRFSHLKQLRKSELHYRHALSAEDESTPSTTLGSAAHCATLEPERFEAEYVVCDLNRNSNDFKAFRAEHDPEKILKTAERDAALRIAEAVRSHPDAAAILAEGAAEQAVTWTDPETGIARKALLDWVTPEGVLIVADLKTAADIGDHAFGRAAETYCYHGQLIDYVGGLFEETRRVYTPVIIAVENKPPFDVRVAEVTGAEADAGERLVRDLHAKLAVAMKTDTWPGQFPTRGKLNLPSWALFDDGDVAESLGLVVGGRS